MTSTQEHDQATRTQDALADRRLGVIDSFIDSVLEGGTTPTPEDVAERAGISRATFFRYFSTLAELSNEAAARVVERFPDLFSSPTSDPSTLDERIRSFVDSRVQLHETLHPLEILMRSHAARDDEAARFVDVVRQLNADEIRQRFGSDLQPHGPARQADMITTIVVLTSIESWQQFRHTFDRSLTQTSRAWRTAIADIFDT